ncbi:uncharacterized protein LOC108485317 [Gossypium arboreum]|uniref:uncharacterized protein LOC108485317 n=1 Tax=Gossypium arboreum TaxID=29729 RepID=UPI0008194141|nr:uncharacterized protein LOC108485317 [Gossypium arboreum]
MAPYEALYGCKCRTPLYWIELGKCRVLSLELVSETENKVSPWKEVLRFGRKGKLSPRFIEPYRILKRVGPSDPSHVISVEEIEVRPDLTFEEKSVHILDRGVNVSRRKSIPLMKVLWRNHGTEEAT